MDETAKDIEPEDLLGGGLPPAEGGHDAWFRAEVEKALADKAAGQGAYLSLEDTAAELEVGEVVDPTDAG